MKKFIHLLIVPLLFSLVSCGGDGDEPTPSGGDDKKQEIESFTVNGITFNMVKVEGGTFQMGATEGQPVQTGDTKNTPVHQVTISTYRIGQTEVTAELWQAVMGSSPYSNNDEFVQAVTNKFPVVHVSWNDCYVFIQKLNQLTGKKFRLPTEAEWEFAARGGNKSKGYIYSGSDDLGIVAWHKDNSSKRVHPVASKLANELNIYDMSGNATEYCYDFYGSYSSSAQTNPQGPSTSEDEYSSRTMRGGDAEKYNCAVAYRFRCQPDSPNDFRGFRLAL